MEPGDGDEADFPYHNEKWRSKPMRKNYDSERIREIFDLTLELADITSATAKCSKSEGVFWDTILKLWKEKEKSIGCNIMYATLYRLYWGCWLKNIESNMKVRRLCELVAEELQERKDILKLIEHKRGFMTPYNAVMKSKSPYSARGKQWKSEFYAAFLKNRTNYHLYGGERVVERLDLWQISMTELEEMKANAAARYRYERFMRLISKLIPESANWDFDAWANENNILAALQLRFGIDFHKKWELFDDMLHLMIWTGEEASYDNRFLNVKELPIIVAKVIWPERTEETIEAMFRTACSGMKRFFQSDFSHAACDGPQAHYLQRQFIDSWLYKQIKAWNNSDDYSLCHETRKYLFDFEMGN